MMYCENSSQQKCHVTGLSSVSCQCRAMKMSCLLVAEEK